MEKLEIKYSSSGRKMPAFKLLRSVTHLMCSCCLLMKIFVTVMDKIDCFL